MLARRGVIADELTESRSHVQEAVLGSSSDHRTTPQTHSEQPHPEPPKTCTDPNCHFSPSTSESASATSSSTVRQEQGNDHHHNHPTHHHSHHHHHEWDNLPGITSEAEVLRQIKMQQQQREQQQQQHHKWDNLPGITSEAEVLRQMQQREQQQKNDGGQEQSQGLDQGSEVQGGNSNKPKQATFKEEEEEGQAGSSITGGFSTEAGGQEQDKGKQREGDSPNRGRGAGSTGKSHEANVGSWSRSRDRRGSSAEDEAGAKRAGEGATQGSYDPNDYDRGAYVETSRVGLE
ncbi:hypothetical protein GE21DRAFT_9726 [Neurospora crassa]|uniref:Uncharacterized protein n=1 Tax=Neurospora crassa (strain ATCC 24698 / 74-OR23-1A / CBS 708.71 / DSM 1257 / FGSC 987) TaxID=367110 RepID=Q7S2T9_NEUCR|nr:hypothetical protein NCU09036 [Neurospora crassa OR74A]EAA29747.2 hypothetical protein NCU09036 [Neurospora crassa OR74A]KHE86163.1 hypothetical protein GE21DRAFT_9726 [Neurospora crassa]|eukprot:XP_958983.2 hypothetical protein NCU09036 [Neurospora crassa OR74A]